MAWTDERVRLLKLWWADGDSAGTIAKRFDQTTRNAVIGKIHRMGLARHPLPIGHKRLPRTTETRARKGRSYHPGGAIFKAPPIKRPTIRQEAPVPQTARMIGILDLDETTCKFPIGDPRQPDFGFCGAEKVFEDSYCIYHKRLAYQPPSGRSRPTLSRGW